MRFRLIVKDTGDYLRQNCEDTTPNKAQAGIFTEKDWEMWASEMEDELRREELGTDEELRASGAPMLPGLDL